MTTAGSSSPRDEPKSPANPSVPPRSRKILVADDDAIGRTLLVRMLQGGGDEVITAQNGAEAIEVFEREQPDLILMDVMMPEVDGYEATRRIKELSKDQFVPVMFLTALTAEKDLAHCIECGGDDFMSKPYNRTVLRSKIAALERLRTLYTTVIAQRDELALHEEMQRRENQIAKTVFERLIHRDADLEELVDSSLSPSAFFNGDLLLTARRPNGDIRLILGDCTGHGLWAAIPALPVSDIFYAMTEKGYALRDVVLELNRKLKRSLPTSLFFAAFLLEIDRERDIIRYWNGGIPSGLVVREGEGIAMQMPSEHLPLGVVDNDRLGVSIQVRKLERNDRVVLYSDGLIEAHNLAGKMFEEEGLRRTIERASSDRKLLTQILEAHDEFIEGCEQYDDTTVLVYNHRMRGPRPVQESSAPKLSAHASTPAAWRLSLRLEPESLRRTDPLPGLVAQIMNLQPLHGHEQNLLLILTELYSNALEHGLLGLESSIKDQPDGFTTYYSEREKRLTELKEGYLQFTVSHEPRVKGGGRLTIEVEDSGPGFDHQRPTADMKDNVSTSGRGIQLVRALATDITHKGCGNIARVTYDWERAEPAQ